MGAGDAQVLVPCFRLAAPQSFLRRVLRLIDEVVKNLFSGQLCQMDVAVFR